MEIFNTMYAIDSINSERYTIQALLTDNACEAPGVVRLPRGPQYAVQDRVSTDTALL